MKLEYASDKVKLQCTSIKAAKKLFGDVVDDTKVSVDDLRNKLNSGECDKKYIQEFLFWYLSINDMTPSYRCLHVEPQ